MVPRTFVFFHFLKDMQKRTVFTLYGRDSVACLFLGYRSTALTLKQLERYESNDQSSSQAMQFQQPQAVGRRQPSSKTLAL
jgi:hypothetical protein